MTVAELRAALADLDGDVLVVMSKDAEATPLAVVPVVGVRHISRRLLNDGDDYVKAVCLWPTN